MNSLFILKTISLKKISTEELKKEYQIYQIKYPVWKNKTYEEFLEFSKSWSWDKYDCSSEDNCYFTDKNEAIDTAIDNIQDLNDGGVYNYILILEVPFNATYSQHMRAKSGTLLKYNVDSDKYSIVDFDYDEETEFISNKYPIFE